MVTSDRSRIKPRAVAVVTRLPLPIVCRFVVSFTMLLGCRCFSAPVASCVFSSTQGAMGLVGKMGPAGNDGLPGVTVSAFISRYIRDLALCWCAVYDHPLSIRFRARFIVNGYMYMPTLFCQFLFHDEIPYCTIDVFPMTVRWNVLMLCFSLVGMALSFCWFEFRLALE